MWYSMSMGPYNVLFINILYLFFLFFGGGGGVGGVLNESALFQILHWYGLGIFLSSFVLGCLLCVYQCMSVPV